MKAEEQYGSGGYRCESFDFVLVRLLTDGSVVPPPVQILEAATTSLLKARCFRLLLQTMAPLEDVERWSVELEGGAPLRPASCAAVVFLIFP
jgi:hypothetical protein